MIAQGRLSSFDRATSSGSGHSLSSKPQQRNLVTGFSMVAFALVVALGTACID